MNILVNCKRLSRLKSDPDQVARTIESFRPLPGNNQMMAYLAPDGRPPKGTPPRPKIEMNSMKLIPILLFLLMVGCVKVPVITPESQAEAEKTIDLIKARELSDSIVMNLINENRVGLHDQINGKGCKRLLR